MPKAAPPLPFVPFALRLPQAAQYVGVSPSKFLDWVQQGRMPKPKAHDRVRLWLRPALEEAVSMLPGDDDGDAAGTGWEDVK